MNDFLTSLIRTWVPMIVGGFVAWLVARGINIPKDAVDGVVAFLTALFSASYYVLVRALEQRFPQFGWLLGQAKQVKYKETK